jgi:hypothetical protein
VELTHLFEPQLDESPLGYYRRLSAANALTSWRELATMAEVSPSRSGLLGTPEHTAAILNIPPAWTARMAQREQELRALRSLHRSRRDAVCPQCLAEEMYLRSGWEHVYVTACVRHKVQLVDRCAGCDSPLELIREQIGQCSCGHELAQQDCEPATHAQLWLSCALTGGVPLVELAPEVAGADAQRIAQLVKVLCQGFELTSGPARRNAAAPQSISQAIEFLAPLERLLERWPKGYEAHVRARIAAGSPQSRTLRALLGRWYQQLRELALDEPLNQFIVPVQRVAAIEFDGVVNAADVDRWEDLRYVRLSDAAKHGQMTVPTLRRAIETNQIGHRTRRSGARGKVFEVLREDLDRIVSARSGWITEANASSLLGVPPKVLGNMAAAGLLEADYDWVKDVQKGGPIRAASIDRLIQALMANQASETAGAECIAFKDLTSRRLGDNTAIRSLMRAIFTGEVAAQSGAGLVGDLVYKLSDVRRFFGTPLLEAGLSISQLAKLTGWKHESIDHWLEQGLMESHAITLRGQPCRVVMPAQLLAFNRTYMPMSDLAKLVGHRSSFMSRRLEQIGVIGGKPTGRSSERGMVVRLADIAALAFSTANLGKLSARTDRVGRVGPKRRAS